MSQKWSPSDSMQIPAAVPYGSARCQAFVESQVLDFQEVHSTNRQVICRSMATFTSHRRCGCTFREHEIALRKRPGLPFCRTKTRPWHRSWSVCRNRARTELSDALHGPLSQKWSPMADLSDACQKYSVLGDRSWEEWHRSSALPTRRRFLLALRKGKSHPGATTRLDFKVTVHGSSKPYRYPRLPPPPAGPLDSALKATARRREEVHWLSAVPGTRLVSFQTCISFSLKYPEGGRLLRCGRPSYPAVGTRPLSRSLSVRPVGEFFY